MYGISIQPFNKQSQYQQLYQQLRDRLIQGALPAGTKLASSRQMASNLCISRAIVCEVYDQLKVEGYVETRHGSGCYVIAVQAFKRIIKWVETIPTPQIEATNSIISCIAGMPDLSLFPRRAWSSCYETAIEYAADKDFNYTSSMGRLDVRTAIRDYLFRARGIQTDVENIIMTAGSAQAIALLAQLQRNASIVIEDPAADFIHEIFVAHGCQIFCSAVDEQGIIPASIAVNAADFIYVSPSHQFPLGGTLSVSRRMELLEYAVRLGAYIIEDDYDGDFRYEQRPIAPLQVLSPDHVIYIGTFSKILSPALRMGYMVVPQSLIAGIKALKKRWDLLNESLNQMAMARFITQGLLERHIRTMLKQYRKRNRELLQLVAEILGSGWKVWGGTTGLHLVLQGEGSNFDKEFEKRLTDHGVHIEPVSTYCIESNNHSDKLVLGYGNRNIEELKQVLLILKAITRI